MTAARATGGRSLRRFARDPGAVLGLALMVLLAALGAGINLRWRAAQGASPWFVEAGTGLVWHSRHYASDDKYFSTRYNFASHLGVGRNFGPQGRHALAVRLQHISNAGIKKPNPGDNFLQLRYAVAF